MLSPLVIRTFRLASLGLIVFLASLASCHAASPPPKTASDFFGVTNLWTFELRLPRSVWDSVVSEANPFHPGPASLTNAANTTLAINGNEYRNIAIRLKGGGTRGGASQGRPPLRLTFRDTNSFPVRELSLNNNVFDSSFMRDALSYKLFSDFAVPAPKTAYVKLYVAFRDSTSGSTSKRYLGLYTVSEIVDEQFIQVHFGDSSGLLLKPELGNLSFDAGRSWEDFAQFLYPKTPATPAQQERMMSFIQLLRKNDAATFREQIGSYIDVDNFLRFLTVTVVLANLDSYLAMAKNYYMYLDPATGKLHWIPWDHDLSFGGFFLCGTPADRINLSIDNPSSVNDTLLRQLLAIPEMKQKYHQLLRDFLTKHFEPQSILRRIDQLAEILQPAVLEEKRKSLADFKRSIDGRDTLQNAASSARSPWEGGILTPGLKLFVERRNQSIQSQLEGKTRGARPRFGQH